VSLAPAARPLAILLIGPTASGKTDCALELARRLPVEIVSVDSAQIYRGLDIGTAKPDAAVRAALAHHLIDIREPTGRYSAAEFAADARALIAAIAARGALPLLTGGTMLYARTLLAGLAPLPPADPALRARLEQRAAERGWPALHAELARVDARTAARLAPGDRQRIQRALEVWTLTGRPLSDWHDEHAAGDAALPFRVHRIALEPSDRARLHARIATRFDAMLAAGLIDELAGLRSRYPLTPELPAMRSVGYRQVWQYLEGGLSRAELRAAGIAATRQLAKRQLTWLRAMPVERRFDCLSPTLAGDVLRAVAALR
jgi:tRNA dimethylallyltransferase